MLGIPREEKFAVGTDLASGPAFGSDGARRPPFYIEQVGAWTKPGLEAGEDDRFPVWQPGHGQVIDLVIGKLSRLPDSGGKQHQFGGRTHERDNPLAVGRKIAKTTVPQPDGRRAIGLAQKNAVIVCIGFPSFRKHNRLAVGRHIRKQRPIKPGQAALARLAWRKRGNRETSLVCRQKNQAGAADIVEGQGAGRTIN